MESEPHQVIAFHAAADTLSWAVLWDSPRAVSDFVPFCTKRGPLYMQSAKVHALGSDDRLTSLHSLLSELYQSTSNVDYPPTIIVNKGQESIEFAIRMFFLNWCGDSIDCLVQQDDTEDRVAISFAESIVDCVGPGSGPFWKWYDMTQQERLDFARPLYTAVQYLNRKMCPCSV